MNLSIRKENPSDTPHIAEVTRAAFATLAISSNTEEYIVEALRDAGALTLSLVAEKAGRIVGHIALSPVAIADGSAHWYGLGPISVIPELHRRGIGKALVHAGLSALKELGAKGCVLVGDPAYYARFGFKNLPQLLLDGVPPQYFLALPFGEDCARGAVTFHAGFSATAPRK